jgi:tRNA G46 methylase TrmB
VDYGLPSLDVTEHDVRAFWDGAAPRKDLADVFLNFPQVFVHGLPF